MIVAARNGFQRNALVASNDGAKLAHSRIVSLPSPQLHNSLTVGVNRDPTCAAPEPDLQQRDERLDLRFERPLVPSSAETRPEGATTTTPRRVARPLSPVIAAPSDQPENHPCGDAA